MTETTDISTRIPLLKDVKVRTAPMPLYFAHWRGLVDNAFRIRQTIAEPKEHGGLDLTLSQHESVKRGVMTICGHVPAKDFLTEKLAGAEEWLQKLCSKVNLGIQGSKPIEKLQLVRLTRTRFLAYYASFYANYMEVLIYIDSGEDIDGASVTHRERSRVDESTRDWKLLADQLPVTIWVKAT
jgi:hypothetical protein